MTSKLIQQVDKPTQAIQRNAKKTAQSDLPPVQTKQGQQSPIQAKQRPVQRKRSTEIAEAMGQQHGVDTSGLQMNHNSNFPKQVGADATIQGNKIDFASGKDTEENIKHEVGHYIINTKRGTPPKADTSVNGQPINTTDEKAADQMASAPIQTKSTGQTPLQRQTNQSEAPIQRRKSTETNILNEVRTGGSFTSKHGNDLIDKMQKGQSVSNAREIAAIAERESEGLLSSVAPNLKSRVKQAIKDYVTDSAPIQSASRGNNINQAVQALDFALNTLRARINGGTGSKARITYRSITYDSMDEVPYGNTNATNPVAIGDIVGDKGFLSTSEHRQFILGKTQNEAPPALLKIAIYSTTGVPIAIQTGPTAYTNQNEQLLWDMNHKNSNAFMKKMSSIFDGPKAGQAEVLFGRNTPFVVKKIKRGTGNDHTVSIVLEETTTTGTVKNMKTGAAL